MEIDGKESFEVYERGKKLEDLIGTDELADHFSDVKRCYGFSSIREYEELKEQGKLDRLQKYYYQQKKSMRNILESFYKANEIYFFFMDESN